MFWVKFFFSFCYTVVSLHLLPRKGQTPRRGSGETTLPYPCRITLLGGETWKGLLRRLPVEAGGFAREVFLCVWGLSKDVPGQGWIFWSPRQPQTCSVKRTPSIWNILLRSRNERAGEQQGEGQMDGGIREACGVLAQVTLSKEEIPELSVEMCQV